jgi:hypothetical protein
LNEKVPYKTVQFLPEIVGKYAVQLLLHLLSRYIISMGCFTTLTVINILVL